MTSVYIHPTIMSALVEIENQLGPRQWEGTTPQQDTFVTKMPALRQLLSSMPPSLMESMGSNDYKVLNAWLRERKYSIQLEPFAPGEIGAVAAIDIKVEWAQAGEEESYSLDQDYPGVVLGGGFTVYSGPSGPVLQPETKDGTRVLFVRAESLEEGLEILQGNLEVEHGYGECKFPMVDFDDEVDVSWLKGMTYGPAHIEQALAQAKLQVNEIGARAKAAVAISVLECCVSVRRATISGPFVIAFMHGNEAMIAFHVTKEHWKRPKDLEG